jgi:hypothetical protein
MLSRFAAQEAFTQAVFIAAASIMAIMPAVTVIAAMAIPDMAMDMVSTPVPPPWGLVPLLSERLSLAPR